MALGTSRRKHSRDVPIPAALSLGAVAFGAFALGALTIGFLAINRLAVRQARFKTVDIDELVIGRVVRRNPRSRL